MAENWQSKGSLPASKSPRGPIIHLSSTFRANMCVRRNVSFFFFLHPRIKRTINWPSDKRRASLPTGLYFYLIFLNPIYLFFVVLNTMHQGCRPNSPVHFPARRSGPRCRPPRQRICSGQPPFARQSGRASTTDRHSLREELTLGDGRQP